MSMRMPTERTFYPRYIARPPKPEAPQGRLTLAEHREHEDAYYAWQHGWTLVYDWSVADELDKGWECRRIEVGDLIARHPDGPDANFAANRARIEKLADAFLVNGGSFVEQVTLETREAALAVVAARLKEVAADGFLLKLLVREDAQPATASTRIQQPEEGTR